MTASSLCPALPLLHGRSALFLDFDGTLAAIAPRPQDVRVEPWVVPTLQFFLGVLNGAVAVVSGRPLAQLDAYLLPLELPAAGVHGVERRDACGRLHLEAGEVPPKVLRAAQRLLASDSRLLLEHKPSALALHFRGAPELGDLCVHDLLEAVRPYPLWSAVTGKCVVEVKPRLASKGLAVRAFMAAPTFAGREAVFVGDDTTDEDGFAAVQAVGGRGVKVGAGPTAALARLADPAAVRSWLELSAASLARPAFPGLAG